jgi:misacylated tRNA(Ala) deacylase
MRATTRLYLDDGDLLSCVATVTAVAQDAVSFDQTCFFPGGGGQPPDTGMVRLDDEDGAATAGAAPAGAADVEAAAAGAAEAVVALRLEVVSLRADDDGVLWHVTTAPPPAGLVGRQARLDVDPERRQALTRAHTALHVLNTIALRDHGGWITGVQIGVEQSRIDFTFAEFSPALCAELAAKANAVFAEDHPVRSYELSEDQFRLQGDLLRTLEARPPVHDGRVRVVEIVGFDAQACGGTHVRSTAEVGRLIILRTDNKGRLNKRLYVGLEPDAGRAPAPAGMRTA